MSTDRFVVRLLEPSDSVEDLTRLINQAYARMAEQGYNATGSYQDPRMTRDRLKGCLCFVAVECGVMVGTATLTLPDDSSDCETYRLPEVCVLNQFAVRPDLKGLGLGGLLLGAVEEKGRELGFSALALDTVDGCEALVRHYQSMGFRGVAFHQWPGKTYRSLIMVKPLA